MWRSYVEEIGKSGVGTSGEILGMFSLGCLTHALLYP